MANSTFSDNSVTVFGGAISNEIGATLNVANSTFSRNSSGVFGGAIDSDWHDEP